MDEGIYEGIDGGTVVQVAQQNQRGAELVVGSDVLLDGNTSPSTRHCFAPQDLSVVFSVIIGSYFGVGLRVALTEFGMALSKHQNDLLLLLGMGYFLPNVVGCFVMGVATRWKPVLGKRRTVVLAGVTTGFCGSCTTFSSWEISVAAQFVHGQWMRAILVLFIQTTTAFMSFRVGCHTADASSLLLPKRFISKSAIDVHCTKMLLDQTIDQLDKNKGFVDNAMSQRILSTTEVLLTTREAFDCFLHDIIDSDWVHCQDAIQFLLRWMIVGFFCTIVAWILPFVGFENYTSSRMLAVSFGPFGALLRYYLSLRNAQPVYKSFPLFTFIPNVTASLLSCIVVIIGSIANGHGNDAYRLYVLLGEGGIQIGLLGSLSTVSTWIAELDALVSCQYFWAYRYGLVSILISQLLCIFVLGMYASYGAFPLII